MPSPLDMAKRKLVKELRALAAKYKVELSLSRESPDKDVAKAFKKVSLRAHPDKGGHLADFQNLSSINDTWRELLATTNAPGRPQTSQNCKARASRGGDLSVFNTKEDPASKREYRVSSLAILLTYQGFHKSLRVFLPVWFRFVGFIEKNVRAWSVKHWTSTAETNEDDSHHLHVMFQFSKLGDRFSSAFSFEGVMPNARSNDLLGEGFGGNRYQSSVDRGQFYAWANKRGTVVDESGNICRAGNCEPAWTRSEGSDLQGCAKVVHKYKVGGDWAKKLWQEYKLEDDVYEEYLFLSKDKLAASKRNFDLYRQWARDRHIVKQVSHPC